MPKHRRRELGKRSSYTCLPKRTTRSAQGGGGGGESLQTESSQSCCTSCSDMPQLFIKLAQRLKKKMLSLARRKEEVHRCIGDVMRMSQHQVFPQCGNWQDFDFFIYLFYGEHRGDCSVTIHEKEYIPHHSLRLIDGKYWHIKPRMTKDNNPTFPIVIWSDFVLW